MKQSLDSSRFQNWKKAYNIILDTTTYCNAKCPQCSRIYSGKGAKLSFAGNYYKELPLIHTPFEKIKDAFTEEELSNYNRIQLCPTWGDHMMHPYALEIVEHFLSKSPRVLVTINTNGSMRDELYWWKLCALTVKYKTRYITGGKRLTIVFAVDGIDQEMHGLYRRNTDLQKILDHVKVCSEFKDTVAVETQTVLFKHNQEHLEEIANLCKKYGSQRHLSVISDRFRKTTYRDGNTWAFYDENDNLLKLDRVTDDWLNRFKEKGAIIRQTRIPGLTDIPTCGWSLTNLLNVNFDGNVWPCCFFGLDGLKNKTYWQDHHPFARKYYDYNNNIYEKKLEDILKNDWWRELPYVIQSKNPIHNCNYNCSNKTGHQGQFMLEKDL